VAVRPDGRIVLAGPVVAAGYRLDPELTAAHFAGDAYLTNDAGRIEPDGRLAVLGRVDDIVVTGGENVPLAAVEEAALHVGAVREAAAFARPDATWGTRVELAVVPRDPARPPTLPELRTEVAARAGRAAAPQRLHVVPALPLLPSGKVDRVRLAAGLEGSPA
jgi:O-succinylbenzoic acid--CoA ligase